jgi:hypothetical protein
MQVYLQRSCRTNSQSVLVAAGGLGFSVLTGSGNCFLFTVCGYLFQTGDPETVTTFP